MGPCIVEGSLNTSFSKIWVKILSKIPRKLQRLFIFRKDTYAYNQQLQRFRTANPDRTPHPAVMLILRKHVHNSNVLILLQYFYLWMYPTPSYRKTKKYKAYEYI